MRKTIFTIVSICILATIASVHSRETNTQWDKVAVQRKVQYVYDAAMEARMDSRDKDSHGLLNYALALDPEDIEVARELAYHNIMVAMDDSATLFSSIDAMRRYFEESPKGNYDPDTWRQTGMDLANFAMRLGIKGLDTKVLKALHEADKADLNLSFWYARSLAHTRDSANIKSAIQLFDSIEVADGQSLNLTLARMDLYSSLSDTAKMVREARRFYADRPLDADHNLLLARTYVSLQQPDSALAYFNNACALDSTNAMAAYSRAMFYFEQKDSVAYDREIWRVLKMEDVDVDTKAEVMRNYVITLYSDTLQRPRILDLFESLVELHPHVPDFHTLYAQYLSSIGRYEEAKEEQQRSILLDPSDINGWTMLVSLDVMADSLADPQPTIDKALEYFPNSPALLLWKYSMLAKDERNEEAEAAIFKADSVASLPNPSVGEGTNLTKLRSDIKMAIADYFFNKDSIDRAIPYYDEALRINPYNSLALNNYAYMLAVNDRDLPRARRMIETALADELTPAEALQWFDTYAWVLFKQGEYDKAKDVIDDCLRITKENSLDESDEIFSHAGDIYDALGLKEEAAEFHKHAKELKNE